MGYLYTPGCFHIPPSCFTAHGMFGIRVYAVHEINTYMPCMRYPRIPNISPIGKLKSDNACYVNKTGVLSARRRGDLLKSFNYYARRTGGLLLRQADGLLRYNGFCDGK